MRITVFALFELGDHTKKLVAVFVTNAGAVEFATICKIESWHVEEVQIVAR